MSKEELDKILLNTDYAVLNNGEEELRLKIKQR